MVSHALENQTIDELLRHLAGTRHGSPGAGSAAAVALALGCACLAKAIDISGLHASPSPELTETRRRLTGTMTTLVEAAARDAYTFAAYLEHPDHGTLERLVTEESDMVTHATDVLAWVEAAAPHIVPPMRGDVFAARTLGKAARDIFARNLRETHESD